MFSDMWTAVRAYWTRLNWAWRQIVTVLAAVAVIVAMVVIAQTARRDERRHQTVQVLVERVRASALQLENFIWRGLAEALDGHQRAIQAGPFVTQALRQWNGLAAAVAALRRADQSPTTRALLNDFGRLYGASTSLIASANGLTNVHQGMNSTRALFAPIIEALDRDGVTAAAVQQRVASEAAARAGAAYFGSLAAGLLVLVLLGVQLSRIRRRALLDRQRRFLEQRTERRIRALVEHSSDIIMVLGPDLTVRWQSTSVQTGLGHQPSEIIGRRVSGLAHPDDVQVLESHLAAVTRHPGAVKVTARFAHAREGWRDLEVIAENRLTDPEIEGLVLSMRDVSDRKALEDELRHQAFHDSLTGLANRALFEDRLAHCLAGARRHKRPVAILFLDLDDFKTINDSLGHASGDALLQAVARRIARVVRVTDTAARLGGDEFAILLESLEDPFVAQHTATRLLEELSPPFEIADRELRISASIGIAVSDGSTGAENLLRNADTAMYAAKEAGKGTVQSFQNGMHERVLARLELTGELQNGLDQDEFELDYQPIVNLQRTDIVGCEALVRWAHPTRGRLLPGDFIGLAEDTGLIVQLGAWILRTACTQAARWERTYPDRVLEVNVNVSTRQLRDPSFTEVVGDAIGTSGLTPRRLVLEITESLLPDDDEQTIARLRELKALGIQVAVDDFGTGHSALSRLQDYPVDILKIDRSFVDGIEHDPGKAQLVRGIVDLGKSLEMTVVAEGIEEPEQAEHLRRLHSPLGQGYLFSRPVSAEQVETLLDGGLMHPPPCRDEPAGDDRREPAAGDPAAGDPQPQPQHP